MRIYKKGPYTKGPRVTASRSYTGNDEIYTHGVRGGTVRPMRVEYVDYITNPHTFEPERRFRAINDVEEIPTIRKKVKPKAKAKVEKTTSKPLHTKRKIRL